MRLSEVSRIVPLEVARDGEFHALGLLSDATPALLACFYDAAHESALRRNPAIACVITTPELADVVREPLGLALAEDPRGRFHALHRHLGGATDFYGRDFTSEISPDAEISPEATISPRRVRIGPRCVVEPRAVVLESVTLAERVSVRSGAVIGVEGFHPVPEGSALCNLPHFGSVRIGRGADIGANAVVCRAVFNGATEIGEAAIVGPLAYVAHGATIGARVRIAAGARIAGGARLGRGVFVGPGAVVSNRVVVGDNGRVSLGSVVVRDVPAGRTVTGNFAVEHERFLLSWARGLRKHVSPT